MLLSWTAFCLDAGQADAPWEPAGAVFAQAGQSAAGRADMPSFDGTWWSVLAVWPDEAAAAQGERDAHAAAAVRAGSAWHVGLEAVSFRGDAVLSGGARPFASLPAAGKTRGASVVVTLAGLGPDVARTTEFFERFVALGGDVSGAPGHRAALVQAATDGAVLTMSAWETLRDAVTWAYHQPTHRETLRRNEEVGLVTTSGFLRCAVRTSSGRLGDRPDPLDGRTGVVVPRQEQA